MGRQFREVEFGRKFTRRFEVVLEEGEQPFTQGLAGRLREEFQRGLRLGHAGALEGGRGQPEPGEFAGFLIQLRVGEELRVESGRGGGKSGGQGLIGEP